MEFPEIRLSDRHLADAEDIGLRLSFRIRQVPVHTSISSISTAATRDVPYYIQRRWSNTSYLVLDLGGPVLDLGGPVLDLEGPVLDPGRAPLIMCSKL